MRNGKINVLNALNIRKTDFPAAHFHYARFNKANPTWIIQIDNWIYENLNGRYYIGSDLHLYNNTITYCTQVGFETEKEISFFKIACPYI